MAKRPVMADLGGDIAPDDFNLSGSRPPKGYMKARPDVRLKDLRVTEQRKKQTLAPTSFSVGEAETLVGARFILARPPHHLVPHGALGVVATYKLLFDEIVLMIRWPDGSHDWFLKCEVARHLR